MLDKNSMLYWHPLIKDLPIPQPQTICIEVNPKIAFDVLEGATMYPQINEFKKAIESLELPVFIRTDQLSGKHSWNLTCFLNSPKQEDLENHIRALVDETLGCDVMGRPVNAFFFRKYIPMDSLYEAFWGQMPVNSERRYFVEDGNILCHHVYWIDEAIRIPSKTNWKQLSKKMNTETPEEISLLTRYAKMVSKEVSGFWSVDFCRSKDGVWYLIDMAEGKSSWHPEDCQHNRTEEIDYMKIMSNKYKKE